MKAKMYKQEWKKFLALTVLAGLLSGCGYLGGNETLPNHPVVESFTINGETDALIVSMSETLRLNIEVNAPTDIERVSLYANDSLLRAFTSTPYVFEWTVNAADNGFYSFRIEVLDELGNSVEANYPNLLAVNID